MDSRFFDSDVELTSFCTRLKLLSCPHCGLVGFLVCHGFLRGYCDFDSTRIVRGRRFFCSNRGGRRGCGRTFSRFLAEVLSPFSVSSIVLDRFLTAVRDGECRKRAWEKTRSFLSLSTGYRLYKKIAARQSFLRTLLLREKAPPPSQSHDPLLQLIDHLHSVFDFAGNSVRQFQLLFQVDFIV